MYRANDLRGLTIAAIDGDIGTLDDVYFDSKTWRVRYLVVDTGTWLAGRRVSIAPHVGQAPNMDLKRLPVALTRAQVEGSPDVGATPPVSRQQEIAWHAYYGYPLYWTTTPDLLVASPALVAQDPREALAAEELAARESGEPNLHSAKDVRGLHIGAADGEVGHVADFLVEVEPWTIRYLIVDTSNWWAGKQVLVAPGWITDVNWRDAKVTTTLTREAIRSSPEYDPSMPVERDYERRLHGHYRRPNYWE
jgi:sporulation protein YlmC with PRC-barrel domain